MVGVSSILLQISGMAFLVSRTYLPVAGEIQFLQVFVHNSFHFRCYSGGLFGRVSPSLLLYVIFVAR